MQSHCGRIFRSADIIEKKYPFGHIIEEIFKIFKIDADISSVNRSIGCIGGNATSAIVSLKRPREPCHLNIGQNGPLTRRMRTDVLTIVSLSRTQPAECIVKNVRVYSRQVVFNEVKNLHEETTSNCTVPMLPGYDIRYENHMYINSNNV